MKILVADDEVVSRTLLWEQVRALGHEVITVSDRREAWEALQREPIRVVVTDWVMPEADGLALCRLIRGRKGVPYVYVLMVTVRGGTDSYLEGMAAGADDFVTKPADTRELAARLRVAERVLALQGEVRALEGLLSTCAYCKRIREGDGTWIPMDRYVERRASLSHGVCTDCYESEVRPELDRLKASVRSASNPAAG